MFERLRDFLGQIVDEVGDHIVDGIENVGNNIIGGIENIELLLADDVETEGKKQGYARAAKEYERVFVSLQREWASAAQMIEARKEPQTAEDRELIARLQAAEGRKERLKKQLDEKARRLSEKQGIPIASVRAAFAGTCSLIDLPVVPQIDILDIVARKKREKMVKAERAGYLEAKALYEEKLRKEREKLERLKEKGSAEIQKLVDIAVSALSSISKTEMEIADLEIMLGEE